MEDERSRQRPEDKFKIPQTSSDEIGWFSSTPVAISRSEYILRDVFFITVYVNIKTDPSKALFLSYFRGDPRVDHPKVEGELSRYMSSYWRVVTEAPASSINLRKRAVPCHRLHQRNH